MVEPLKQLVIELRKSRLRTRVATRCNTAANVTTSKPSGPVIIQSGANITIDADDETNITDNFEVQLGAQLEIK